MKVIVSKKRIETAVKNLCRVVNSKNALPILGYILCEVDEQMHTMQMTASDGEVYLSDIVGLDECEGGGRFCVPANHLAAALDGLPEQPLALVATTESDNVFTVTYQTGSVHFALDNAEEYPTPPEFDDKGGVTMVPSELATAISMVSWSTAIDNLRPVMEGVYLNFRKGKADITASDGHTMMLYRIERDHESVGAFIMPKKVAKMLPAMLTKGEAEDVLVLWNDLYGRVERDSWQLTFRLIDGTYPKYESVIPKDSPYTCDVDRLRLMNAISKVRPFTPTSSNMILCRFETSKLIIEADNADFAMGAQDTLEVTCDAPDGFNIGLKAQNIISILQKMPGVDVTMHLSDPSHAVLFTQTSPDVDDINIIGLSMPMLINE